MKIDQFEDMIIWQKSKVLSLLVYSKFRSCKDYSFRDQIQRASVSIMNNSAEGFERRSNKELKNFLFIAKGSCGEVRSMLHLSLELKYLSGEEYKELMDYAMSISRMISAFIKKLN